MRTGLCRVADVPPARAEAILASLLGDRDGRGTRGQDVRDTFSYTFSGTAPSEGGVYRMGGASGESPDRAHGLTVYPPASTNR